MKKAILILLLLVMTVVLFTTNAQERPATQTYPTNKGIQFKEGNWNSILNLGKKSKKYIFIDAYTSCCAPCKLLKSQTFMDKGAAAYFNKNFIDATFDMEKGEGLSLAEKWNVGAYPTLLFFTPEGKLVMKQVGFVDGKRLREIEKQSLTKK